MWQGSSVVTVLWEEGVTDTDISQELIGAPGSVRDPVSKSKVKCSQENTQVVSGTHVCTRTHAHTHQKTYAYTPLSPYEYITTT